MQYNPHPLTTILVLNAPPGPRFVIAIMWLSVCVAWWYVMWEDPSPSSIITYSRAIIFLASALVCYLHTRLFFVKTKWQKGSVSNG